MIYDLRDLTSRRYLVLLAAKPQGKRDHGRVWCNNRGDAYMLCEDNQIQTVTSVADWLRTVGLMEPGPVRNLGGRFLVPTAQGLENLETTLRPGQQAPAVKEEK